MASFFGFLHRSYQSFFPPVAAKTDSPLKFGILGAANIAPLGLIIPAKTHPEVVIQAVAARDRKKAEAYAKKHGIPEVKNSYQEILDDPSIDCVYIPLPNGLHFEWAMRAVRAGKHVLLEKPLVSNTTEAQTLFSLPELAKPQGQAPVVLEAFHYRFHPSWQRFLSFLTPADIAHAEGHLAAPHGVIAADDIRFKYDLAGGSMMDIGTYALSAIRLAFDAEPQECLECEVQTMAEPYDAKCDYGYKAKFRFPNGGIGEAHGSLRGQRMFSTPFVKVTHKETSVPDDKLSATQEKVRTREVTLWNIPFQWIYHRIDVVDTYTVRSKSDGKVSKTWKEKAYHKAYTFDEGPTEPYWTTYRCELEQFVNRIRGRETNYWVSHEDSVSQTKMLDMAYAKSGLPLRPTSTYK